MLHTPDRHETLTDEHWSAERAQQAVQDIVLDIEQRHATEGRWPLHPQDDEGDEPAGGFKNLYLGDAGLWWALWHLQREGAVALQSDPAAAIATVLADYRAQPGGVPSYLMGEAGILLVQWRLTGSPAAADALHAVVQANIGHPSNESLWAAPGTMLAAWHLWQATGQTRWRELFVANVDQLLRTWLWDDRAQCLLWTQDMYGKVVQYYGAGHGFAGNAYPLLKGAALLDDERRDTLYRRCLATLRALAVAEDGAVNWPGGSYTPRPGSPPMLMQWCHGAPGIVTATSDFPGGLSDEMDALLLAAGEAVWRAGPLAKGHGLCHGTAGNGYAFLKLHQRTGDDLWLERARAFAMHALQQCERAKRDHGQGRYTLWTGDAGLALYLWHCIRGEAALPSLDRV